MTSYGPYCKCTVSETKLWDNDWGKQALFLTFAQNNLKSVIYLILCTNHYNCKGVSIKELTLKAWVGCGLRVKLNCSVILLQFTIHYNNALYDDVYIYKWKDMQAQS